MTSHERIKVMVADDHAIVREGLKHVLEQSGEFEVVGQAADGEEAVKVAAEVAPDVVVMDVMMPLKDGVEACREIMESAPETRVVMLTVADEETAVLEAVAAGATGYLQKETDRERLLSTVRGVFRGEYRLPAGVVRGAVAALRSAREVGDAAEAAGLTPRERGFELWEGAAWPGESVALFEDQGRMVIGDVEAVKSLLRMLDSGSGSLLDDADSDLGRALKRAGAGWISSAQEQCLDYEIRGCRAVGVSLRRGVADYVVDITIAALFRNERTAESELDELESQIEEDSSFEFDIDDVQLDGDFVIVTASADEDDLFEDEDDLVERESPAPAPVAPTVTAIRDAPDIRDDHGDSADEATFASVGETVTGVLGHGRDVDYFAFAAERGQTYRIDVDLGTLDDSVAALYDSGSRQLEFDDDGGDSFGSRITWVAAESGTHYVAVAGWGDTGSYTLTVTATESEEALDEPAPSDEADEAGSGRPDSPANQRYEYDGSAVVLTWDASPGADSYTVYYHAFFDSNCRLSSGSPSFCEELATNVSNTRYTHTRPDPGEHYYWVVACNSVGCSEIDSSNPAQLGGSPPDAPANQRYAYDGAAIVLNWDASAGADAYTVYYDDFFDSSCRLSLGGASFCEELATDLTVTTFTHADPGRDENYYWVVACNRFGCSTIDSANPARVAP